MTTDQWTQIAIAVGAVLTLLTALYILSHASSLLSTAEKRCAAHQAAREKAEQSLEKSEQARSAYLKLLRRGAIQAGYWEAGESGCIEWQDEVGAAIRKHEGD